MLTKYQIKELIADWEKAENLHEECHAVDLTFTNRRIEKMIFLAGDKGLNALLARVAYDNTTYPELNVVAVAIATPLEGWVAVAGNEGYLYQSLKDAQANAPGAIRYVHMREVRQ